MTTRPLDYSEREQCLDDILTAYFKAVEAGQAPDRDEICAQNPALAEELREFFVGQDRLDQFAAPLRPVALAARQDCFDTRLMDDTPHDHAERDAQALPGVIGEHELLAEIAHGGMGIVYKARHRKLHRLVALK